MPEWLQDSSQGGDPLSLGVLVFRLAVAFLLGGGVTGIYRLTNGKPGDQSKSMMATLVLLTVLISMVTLVIGNSVARAFGLAAALGIIRFRTIVEDTRDTAFVIFAVAVGMAVGAGYLVVALVGIPFTAAAAFLFRSRPTISLRTSKDFTLTVRLGTGFSPNDILRPIFDKYLENWCLATTSTTRQGTALDLTYQVHLRSEDIAPSLVADLNALEGVQEVELGRE